jgi:N-acetylornithine carbamoyltransferase
MSRRLKHFLSPAELSPKELSALLDLAARLKRGEAMGSLRGKHVGLLFFDPSLRTRTSMNVAIHELGGHAVNLDIGRNTYAMEHREGVRMDETAGEHVKEAVQVLGEYVDALGVRTFPNMASWKQERQDPLLNAFVRWTRVPLINLESTCHHPCQALADALTLQEMLHEPKGKTMLVTWNYHPKPTPMAVTNSILTMGAMLGMRIRLAHPEGFDLDQGIVEEARQTARKHGGSLDVTHDPDEGYAGANVVYAKDWGSWRYYGRWGEERALRNALQDWIVTEKRMRRAPSARFMHCLPVRRNVVVEDAVLDSPASAVIQQAGNRLHVQKAVLLKLLGGATLTTPTRRVS